jgi:DNA-binding CsgD family transcriptional regulator
MLYGRDREQSRISALLDAARASHSGALVVRGEPGVGKSALLEDARERAGDMRVLAARAIESESELPYAALHQLLLPAADKLDELPAAQAQALKAALGLADGSGHERFLVFAGCLSLLSELAESQPVLCLVDDAHWLDLGSADALRFVARRLEAEGVVVLFAAREGEIRKFEAADVPSLHLSGLDAVAATELLAGQTGVDPAPGVRDRLVEETRGNALALVEVRSGLTEAQLIGDEPLPEALPLTGQVESIFLERVRRLPDAAQRLLLVAAADDSESVALVVRAAAGMYAGPEALEAAEQAGLLSVAGRRFEFRHPLVRSAIYGSATSMERRAVHSALAEALVGDEEHVDRRAWHLAASALEPDEGVVSALEEAAERAQERAGYMAAASALERAADLSADDRARGGRLASAARCASVAGADEDVLRLARRALPLVDEPELGAELRSVIGLAEMRRGRPLEGLPLLVDAAREVGPIDSARALELLMWASWAAMWSRDVPVQVEAARLAASLAPSDADEGTTFVANLLAGFAAMTRGDTAEGARLIDPALEWGADAEASLHVFQAAMAAFWLGDDDRIESLLNRTDEMARDRGEVGMLVEAQGIRSGYLIVAQRYDELLPVGTEALQLARELGAVNLELLPRACLAIVSAIRGQGDEARRQADAVLELGSGRGLPVPLATATWALGLVDLGRGRWEEALERLTGLIDEGSGVADSYVATLAAPDRVEAGVRANRLEEARAALTMFESWATDTQAAAAQSRLASCRALVAEGDEATRHFEVALELRADAKPFDLARIQLLFGEHLRRERRRVDARTHLRAALEGFERHQADPWAERARAELRATGESARKRDPSTLSQLTPQELQIAGYVAEGLTNKEIAAHMFLSKRTIDYHLRNVFMKLGISSRTQLAGLRLADEASPERLDEQLEGVEH